MKAFVVDVNVLIVANARETEQASIGCVLQCVVALEEVQQHLLVLDDIGLIFDQYQRYNNFYGQPGLGDAFFKWVYNHQYDSFHVELVDCEQAQISSDLARFDPADQVYLQAAQQSQNSPVILNATDRDWMEWLQPLEQQGFSIRFLCPELMSDAKII